MEINGKTSVITEAVSGIGKAAALALVEQTVKTLALVDLSNDTGRLQNFIADKHPNCSVKIFQGDTTDADFRTSVFNSISKDHGPVNICVPAAGITRDELAIKIKKINQKLKFIRLEISVKLWKLISLRQYTRPSKWLHYWPSN